MTSVPSSSTLLGLLSGSSSSGAAGTSGAASGSTDGADAFASELVTSLQLAASQPQGPAALATTAQEPASLASDPQTPPPSLAAAPATGSDPNATPAGPLAELAPAGPQGTHSLPATPTPASTAASAVQETSSGAPVVSADLNESVDTTGRAAPKATGRHAAATHPDANPAAATSNQLSVPGPVSAVAAAVPNVTLAPTISTLDSGADAADAAADSEQSNLSIDSATAISASFSTRPVSARSHLGAASAAAQPSTTAGQTGATSTATVTLDAIAATQPALAQASADQPRHSASDAQGSASDSSITAPVAAPGAAAPAASVAPTAPAAAPAPTPAPLQTQLSQPILSLKTAAEGTHVLTIRVAPEAIGPVTVRAHISAGSLKVELIAPNSDSTSALNSILPDLKRDLAQGGMNAMLSLHQHSADLGSGSSGSGQSSSGQSPFGQSTAGQASSGGSGNASEFGAGNTADAEQVTRQGVETAPPVAPAPSQPGDTSLDVLA